MSSIDQVDTRPTLTAQEATVYIPTRIHPEVEIYARKKFKRVIQPNQDGLTADQCLELADGIVSRTGNLGRKELSKAPKLRMITRNGTGCDNIDLEYCEEKGIIVLNNPGANAAAVAELSLTLALNVVRRVKEIDSRITRNNEKIPSIDILSGTLLGSTIGLIGMGDTAHHLCRMLQAFNCTILVYSPTSPMDRWTTGDPKYQPINHHRVGLEELLSRSDVVSVQCPLTPLTRGMISAEEFRKMKRTAVIVNCARGGIIDEQALLDAIKNRSIAGAGIDCWEVEPASSDTIGELARMDNVICLPHVAGSTEQVQCDTCKTAVDMLANYFDGKGYKNRVV